MSDEQLMEAYRSQSSEDAFRELYARYESRLFRFLVRRLPRSKTETVNDLFQKTWLKVHASRSRFDSARTFSSWFFTIAVNTLRDHVDSAREKAPHEELDETAHGAQLASGQEDQERLLLKKEDWTRAEAALARLVPNQREAFLLAEGEGLSAREIGEALGVSEAGVRQLLSRARGNLRKALGQAKGATSHG